jgi:hypothetical protein
MDDLGTITFNSIEDKVDDMDKEQRACLNLLFMAQDHLNLASYTKDSLEKQLGELLENVSYSD